MSKQKLTTKEYLAPFILISSLFFLWGIAHGMLDTLNKHFQDMLHLSKAQSGMIQFSVYARPCVNFEQLSKHLGVIQKMVPEAGNVRLLYITDEQWEKSVTVIGPNYDQGKRANKAKIPDQVEFWE